MLSAQDYAQLNQLLADEGWQRTRFEGGQNHLMGWSVMSTWQQDKFLITLTHSERYNEVRYEVEANPLAYQWLIQQGYAHAFDD
ncbi:MAG: hypothetical protein RBS36_02375 [Thiomicrospira sp.]|jgi:hypothetical protein|nr:hypothetical protein [Thiomicrospira sp.]